MIIDKRSMVPIYEQIINQYKALIACNIIGAGEQLDSVRSLSASLGINPNTIQKAYTELENQHICSSAPGKGRFVTADAKNLIKQNASKNTRSLDIEIANLVLSGLSKGEIDEIIKLSYIKASKKVSAIKSIRKETVHD
jgi:GntR family transcriptional regulator